LRLVRGRGGLSAGETLGREDGARGSDGRGFDPAEADAVTGDALGETVADEAADFVGKRGALLFVEAELLGKALLGGSGVIGLAEQGEETIAKIHVKIR